MLPPVYNLLSNDSATLILVGTDPVRVFPAGSVPQKQIMPSVTWQTVGGAPINLMSSAPSTDYQRVQIDCWANDYATAEALCDAVRLALENNGYCVSFNGRDYEPETKRYRISMDWSFYIAR